MSDTKYGKNPLYAPRGKIYFIGDIHNEAYKFISLLEQIEPLLTPDDHIVFLGDLFDREMYAAELAEALVALVRRYPDQVFFIEGNHCRMLKDYLVTGRTPYMEYLESTLKSFVRTWNLPDHYPDTIMNALLAIGWDEVTSRTIPYYETEHVIGTHAPFDAMTCRMYGIQDYAQDYIDRYNGEPFTYFLERLGDNIMWQFVNDESQDVPWIHKYRVNGHQPGPGKQKHPRIFDTHAFIDTGCGKGDRPVTCLEWPSKKYYQSRTWKEMLKNGKED